jgi:hypothetical protein
VISYSEELWRAYHGSVSAYPPLPIERMRRICRKPVVANGRAMPALIDRPLALVAIAAKRAQRTEHKGVVIAAMSRMMIGDRGRNDAPLLLAKLT